jgi:signal transduction histidine kinase
VPDLVDIALPDVFRRLQQLLTPELRQRKIDLRIQTESLLPHIRGDSRQLDQLFLNLVRNSIDAMPRGGEIRITAATNQKMVEVAVRDTGVGIPEESLPLVFDPFYTTKDTGTGLGLSYVQQVVQEHQATVKSSSRLGKGTEFRIQFHPFSRKRSRSERRRNTVHE